MYEWFHCSTAARENASNALMRHSTCSERRQSDSFSSVPVDSSASPSFSRYRLVEANAENELYVLSSSSSTTSY